MIPSRRALCLCSLLVIASACGGTPAGMALLLEEPRPVALPAGVDLNSAYSYYSHGARILDDDPAGAARAFAWASQLDPTWAAPVFGRRIALLMADPDFFSRYMGGTRSALRDPRAVQLDSMYLRALELNPFVDRAMEGVALRSFIRHRYRRSLPGGARFDEAAFRFELENYLRSADFETRAWLAHADGAYVNAATLYERALRGKRGHQAAWTRVELARVLHRAGRHQAAAAALEQALDELRERDERDLVRVYNSKAVVEHTLGLIYEQFRGADAARDRYARALQEDLSYYPAHLRLAALALLDRDLEGARASYQLALDIAPGNALVLFSAGQGFLQMGDFAEAERTLRALRELQPAFATPHFHLGQALEGLGRTDDAVERYRHFLEYAPAGLAERREAQSRVTALASTETPEGQR